MGAFGVGGAKAAQALSARSLLGAGSGPSSTQGTAGVLGSNGTGGGAAADEKKEGRKEYTFSGFPGLFFVPDEDTAAFTPHPAHGPGAVDDGTELEHHLEDWELP